MKKKKLPHLTFQPKLHITLQRACLVVNFHHVVFIFEASATLNDEYVKVHFSSCVVGVYDAQNNMFRFFKLIHNFLNEEGLEEEKSLTLTKKLVNTMQSSYPRQYL